MYHACAYVASAEQDRHISFLFHGRSKTMKFRVFSRALTAALLCCALLPLTAAAQSSPSAATALSAAAQQQKFAFVMFWKQQDSATDAVYQSLQTHLAAHADRATTVAVQVTDPGNRDIVRQFNVSRAPMPLVLAVAPNSAVTSAYQSELTAQQVSAAIVTPAVANCLKGLQDGKTVLMLIHPQADAQQAPQGTRQFLADPQFSKRTTFVRLVSTNPAEGEFLKKLGVTQQDANGCVVMMAPPGVLVGKFPLGVSGQELAKKLHAAGKCCDDENCKHNR